jgi:hypothetical protein
MNAPLASFPPIFTLERDRWGRLVYIDAAGQRREGVTPVRAFPVSDVEHWVSICDAEGHEIVLLEDVTKLPDAVRQTLSEELVRREFIPVIEKIVSATTQEPSQWYVETDRGPVAFQINSEDDVRRLGPQQASVIDSHGTRYLIPDIRRLDGISHKLLDHFL